MTISVIIFDLGGVVLTNDWSRDYHELLGKFSEAFNATIDGLHKGWKAHFPFFVGETTEDEFWRDFLEAARAKNPDIRKAKRLWRKYQSPLENMLVLLKKLKERYRLAALTNLSREWTDFKREKFGLDGYFTLIVSSGYAGVSKPDRRAYENVVKELKERPENCLYIDDRGENLGPARELGMKTMLFTGQKDLERKLNEVGVEF